MKKPGFDINTDKIAEGILGMIRRHPDGACMTLGMFPADIMDCLERVLKEKIPDHYLHVNDRNPLQEIDGKEVRREVTRAVCSRVLALASESGLCIV